MFKQFLWFFLLRHWHQYIKWKAYLFIGESIGYLLDHFLVTKYVFVLWNLLVVNILEHLLENLIITRYIFHYFVIAPEDISLVQPIMVLNHKQVVARIELLNGHFWLSIYQTTSDIHAVNVVLRIVLVRKEVALVTTSSHLSGRLGTLWFSYCITFLS